MLCRRVPTPEANLGKKKGEAVTTRTHGGLGMGLAIAKAIMELHGGTITVEKAASGGSTFVVTLPTAGGS